MKLATAKRYAEQIVAWLMPYCDKIQVAGSIRRDRLECHDIDLVVIPKHKVETDMLGVPIVKRNLLWEHLEAHVKDHPDRAGWLSGQNNPCGQNHMIQLAKCQLDIFSATDKTWGTMLLCRTGSKEHNIWLADRIKRMGGHWSPYSYLRLDGTPRDVQTEEAIYRAVGLDFIPPAEREIEKLRSR